MVMERIVRIACWISTGSLGIVLCRNDRADRLKGGENMDMASMIWEQASCMNQIRFYQLRMMEQPLQSIERDVYREQIRTLQETQKTLLEVVEGCE